MPADFQLEYKGTVMGRGTPFGLRNISGLSPPDSRQSFTPRSADHGSFPFAQFLEHRIVTLEGYVHDSSALDSKLDQLRSTFAPTPTTEPLIWKPPNQNARRIYCLPTRRSWPYDSMSRLGYTEFAVELVAADPRIYDDLQQQAVLSASTVILNSGSFPTYPVVTIEAVPPNPVVNPKIELGGEVIQLNITFEAPLTLTIDFLERTIFLSGLSRYDVLKEGSVWWDLEPGSNTVLYSGGGSAKIMWRSAWI